MLRQVVFLFALSLVLCARGQKSSAPSPQARREAPSDLEVLTYDSTGARKPATFLTSAFLASLPQVSVTLDSDENFPEVPLAGVHIKGVDLETLIHAIEPTDPSAVAVAICRDGYTSPFPRKAMSDHHPILVLTMDDLTPQAWAAKQHTYDPSPYFVVYQNFVPSFRILAHEDRPQHPAEIVYIKVLAASRLFADITPPDIARIPPDSPVMEGFRIAQQNCFRCHNSGETGGTKAQRTWQHLAEIAKSRPDFFAAWVHNPQSIDPKSKMTPNLKYDEATLKALTRYFQTFAP